MESNFGWTAMLCGLADIKLTLTSLTLTSSLSILISLSLIASIYAATVRKVRANWLNSSSAQVWWEQLMLPQNADVLEYLVYVHRDASSELSEGEIVIKRWRFEPESGHGLVTGLNSHAGYSVSVRAKVRDTDGTVFETDKSPEIRVFIPGKSMHSYCHSAKLSTR